MKYAFPVLLALLLGDLATSQESRTEELVPKAKWTKEQLENPPARNLKADFVREPFEVPLERSAPPSLAERKFVAIVRLPMPVVEGHKSSDKPYYYPGTKLMAGYFDGGYLLRPVTRLNVPPGPEPNRAQLKFLLTQLPAGALDKETVDFFQSPEVDQGFLQFIGRRDLSDGTHQQEFRIFGKSAEECERYAKGLMPLLDYGFSRPMQLSILQWRDENADALKTSKAKLENRELETQLEKVSKQVVELKDFTVEMLPVLRQQQMVLDVNLAGTNARIKACEKLLEVRNSADRRSSLENLKIQAEIELAGHQAQRTAVVDFIGKVNQRTDLSYRESQLKGEIDSARNFLVTGPVRLSEIDANLDYYAPLKVVDNKIVIRPVEWIMP